MKRSSKQLPVLILLPATVLLIGCAQPRADHQVREKPVILFEDDMADNWQANWFLDGKKATVEHRDGGLYFAAGTITKSMDREAYHAHHAVLWTRQVFEGDLRISYEVTRMDDSGGTTLLYIQAQGTGQPPYDTDIYAWRHLREVPAMDLYFKHMSLLSLSFRENLRCKRYPWFDTDGNPFEGVLLEPMVDYPRMEQGKTYRVEVEKRKRSLTLRLRDVAADTLLIDHTWDTTKNPEQQLPRLIEKGRIGLRHMSTRQMTYRHMVVERL